MIDWAYLVIVALLTWGWAAPSDISVQVDSEWANPYIVGYAEITNTPGVCTIHISPLAHDPAPDPTKLITHEVGHCLWLSHTEWPGLMGRYHEDWTEFSAYDRAIYWHRYPAPYRVTLGMVSNE